MTSHLAHTVLFSSGHTFCSKYPYQPPTISYNSAFSLLHMSLGGSPSLCSSSLELAGHHRKRTSSFSCPSSTFTPSPRPTKAPRTEMSSLRRTESCASLSAMQAVASTSSSSSSAQHAVSPAVPYTRTLRYYKEQRERRKALINRSFETRTSSDVSPPDSPTPVTPVMASYGKPRSSPVGGRVPIYFASDSKATFRTSSPLSPMRAILPARPSFPRSKAEPDLYRQAITTRMRCSPDGQKILHMGPRLALSIMAATKELERIVAAQSQSEKERERENDVMMAESAPTLSNSWVVVPGEDWEMIDCGA